MEQEFPTPSRELQNNIEPSSHEIALQEMSESEQELFPILLSLESNTEHAEETFQKIETFVKKFGWKPIFENTLLGNSLKKNLRNPEMASSLLIECLHAIGTPSLLSIQDIEKYLKQTQNAIDWVKLNSFLEKRKKAEHGNTTYKSKMIRILEFHGFKLTGKETESEIQELFREAIQSHPPDAYFSEYFEVEEMDRKNYVLDPYMNCIKLTPVLEESYRREWGGNDSILAYAKMCTAIKLAHEILAIYNPSGRFITALNIKNVDTERPPTTKMVDFYTAVLSKENRDDREYEDESDRAYRLLVTFFDLLPEGWKEQYRKHYSRRVNENMGIDELHALNKKMDAEDVKNNASKELRLFTPAEFGNRFDDYIENEIRKRTKKLARPISIDLADLNKHLNREYPLPPKDIPSTEKIIQSLNIDAMISFERALGIKLSEISLRELFCLFEYLQKASPKEGFEEIRTFMRNGKIAKNRLFRLKAFLSLEHGGAEMGKHILRIGKSFPTESADAIFAKYAEIIETAEKSEQYIRENLSPKAQENISISAISDQLLIRGKDMLLGFSRKISTAEKLDAETILSDLERIKGDVILFGNVFRAFAKDNPHATFEDFKELRLNTKTGIETARNENDVSQMMEIARNNYTDNAALQTLVLKSLEDGLHKEQSEFFILKRNDRITVFCQYEDRGDFFSAASFNVHPEYRGSALGEVMLHASLDRKAKEKPVYAVTDPEKSVCNSYVERYGFVINDIDHAKVGEQEVLGVNILRDDSVNDSYHYRQDISVSDLAKEMERQRTDSPKNILKKKAPFILSFDRKTKMASFLRIAEKLLREYGYVITRYVPKQKNDDTLLVAFEQKKQPNRLPVPETQKPL